KLLEEYRKYSLTNHSPSSQKRYRAVVDHFNEFLRGYSYLTKLSQLELKTFEDYKGFRKEQEAANKTINFEIGCLRAIFYLAKSWGYIKENPAVGVKRLKEDTHKKPRFLTMEEVKLLLENCGDDLYPIFHTFLNTGMRKSELEHLEWKDIDFIRKKIKIRVKDTWRPKSSEREIPINEGLIELLTKHKKTKQGTLVFHRDDGQPIEPNSLRKKLMTLTKNLGFPDVTKLHTLRHTFASYLVMKGVDLPTVKKLLGHSSIDMTMIYSHLSDEHVDKAVEKLKF
ncbi:MAG: tyrosine-type recombinase/integrase, partial [Candidatus Omnitrophica bacterium]|nr:tyrosine-type recombinase/integrase [Candidatus Omnitrophota bacterium]